MGAQSDPLLRVQTTCGALLYELQIIWDEVGEAETDRDQMLLEIEQECLEVYRRKVDQANRCKAQLKQAIADAEAEIASICSAVGERPEHIKQSEQKVGSLKEELCLIHQQLEEMRKRKQERKDQFIEIIEQIQKVSKDIYGDQGCITIKDMDESDLSAKRLEELQNQLQKLQNEKSDRLRRVMLHLSCLNLLCSVLGLDFKQKLSEVHPSLSGSEEMYSLSNDTFQSLESAITRLRELKLQRMQRLQDLATAMLELWNLMDTPVEEQQAFQSVTCNIAASEDEITEPNMLSSDFMKHVEAEVSRLEEHKSSKMKELVLKKRSELEDICRRTHLVPKTNVETESFVEAIDSGALDPAVTLEQIELEIGKVKEEAFSRKEILDKVEKWLFVCEEEAWLEEYNMDENRYGRGAHLTLKRAEKARALVNKLPGMVDALAWKVRAWENERGVEFTYDGAGLLSMIENYTLLKQEKEEERRRQREQKKLRGLMNVDQEARFGSKPSSPMKLQTAKKSLKVSTAGGNNKKMSLGGTTNQTPRPSSAQSNRATPFTRTLGKAEQTAEDDSGLSNGNVRKVLEMGALLVKNYSFNGRDHLEPPRRRPFSPIPSATTTSSRANTNVFDDPNRPSKTTLVKNDPAIVTPVKTKATAEEEENKTPQVMKLPPSCDEDEDEEEIEYSFEERRLGFVLPPSSVQV